MKKEDIESAAKILSQIKDSLDEFESALDSNNSIRAGAVKIKILNLQSQIGRML